MGQILIWKIPDMSHLGPNLVTCHRAWISKIWCLLRIVCVCEWSYTYSCCENIWAAHYVWYMEETTSLCLCMCEQITLTSVHAIVRYRYGSLSLHFKHEKETFVDILLDQLSTALKAPFFKYRYPLCINKMTKYSLHCKYEIETIGCCCLQGFGNHPHTGQMWVEFGFGWWN